jgi:DNA topoisomerase-1
MGPKFYKKKNGFKQGTTKTTTFSETDFTIAKYLIIVESPSKCKKIEGYLGKDYKCIASKGHIRNIQGLKSINTRTDFEPTFSIIEEKTNHVEHMRKIIDLFQKDNIILASDDDREGEAIAWHICQIFDLPIETTKRIIFHEITESAIKIAIENPILINMNIVHAQHARQILDIIVGYKISPYLWKYISNNDSSLSAGRCQTPALRLVYDNEKEKLDNTNIQYYKTSAVFLSKNINFQLNREFTDSEEVLQFLEKSKNYNYKMSIGNKKEMIKSPPKPFSTSRLLQTSSNILHLSPKYTMDICQKLYQNGDITYMRTDSMKYSIGFINNAKKYIESLQTKWSHGNSTVLNYIGNLDTLTNKDDSNPHEAIRPTDIQKRHLNSGDNTIDSVYKMIWTNTMESCMADAKYNTHEIRISAPDETYYSHQLEIPVFIGWKIITQENKKTTETDEQNDSNGLLFYFQSIEKTNYPIIYNWIESKVANRSKHNYYTEASLIHQLEELGIGRPSTFATIVETIKDRGYVKRTNLEGSRIQCKDFKMMRENNSIQENIVERIFGAEKNKLIIQPIGISTIEFLFQYFESLFSYEYTRTMEEELDQVVSGKEWTSICKNCHNEIKRMSKPVVHITKEVYRIDDEHEWTFNKFGPVIKRTHSDDGAIDYIKVRKDIIIDIEKLKKGEYELSDLVELKSDLLGKYKEENVYIKSGRFGAYIEWGENNKQTIKSIKKQIHEITIDDVIPIIECCENGGSVSANVLRVLNKNLSIRKGKYGAYVYYKTPLMTKPQFLDIKKFPEGFFVCSTETLIDWLCTKYGITK